MHKVVYQSPNGLSIENIGINKLKEYIIDQFPEYLYQGNGGASLDFYDGEIHNKSLLILPNEEYGIYLKYLVLENGKVKETWLSLEDRLNLNETAECSDEWFASIGLFLPKEKAWLAIEEFYLIGERTNKIEWLDPDEIPEGGNY